MRSVTLLTLLYSLHSQPLPPSSIKNLIKAAMVWQTGAFQKNKKTRSIKWESLLPRRPDTSKVLISCNCNIAGQSSGCVTAGVCTRFASLFLKPKMRVPHVTHWKLSGESHFIPFRVFCLVGVDCNWMKSRGPFDAQHKKESQAGKYYEWREDHLQKIGILIDLPWVNGQVYLFSLIVLCVCRWIGLDFNQGMMVCAQ